MRKARDYKAEYQRRITNAAKRGLSRSQARGHARAGEKLLRPRERVSRDIPAKVQAAIKRIQHGESLTAAAREARIAPERLRRYLYGHDLVKRTDRAWHFTDKLHREMNVTSNGEDRLVRFNILEQASLNGRHQAAIKAFVNSNDTDFLTPFVGQSVIDTSGTAHPLETDPNTLFRLRLTDERPFHEIYQLTL